MFFSWFTRRRRRKLLADPWPNASRELLAESVWQYAHLDAESQRKLEETTRVLVAEKNWEGCDGFELTEESKIVVAGQAALTTLGFQEQRFDRVLSILIYPDAFVMPRRSPMGGGLVIEEEQELEGEAWYRGPVILSWQDAQAGGRDPNDGRNVVIHEFAHQLDMLTGEANGTPPIDTAEKLREWTDVTGAEYKRLIRDCRRRGYPLLDCYGAESPTEFFAVASEAFFQLPDYLRREAPELFRVFADYYRQDPAWSEESYLN
jgi:Mlc titration factor MtfA (ptsG expression regulator)